MSKEAYLTVDEVAELLRIHRNTVYRWCREGKLKALRFGKGWRIPRAALDEHIAPPPHQPERRRSLEESWPPGPIVKNWCAAGDHVMALVDSQEALIDLEAAFLKEGTPLNVRLFKACWWQRPDDVRQQLADRGLDVEALEGRGRLRFANLQEICDEDGPEAAAAVWVEQTLAARRDGYERLWGCGSPYLAESEEMHGRLRTFETLLSHRLNGLPVIGLCTYFMDARVPDFLAKMTHLIRNHWGLLTYPTPDNMAFARLTAE